MTRASARDRAEVAAGRGSARDRAEAGLRAAKRRPNTKRKKRSRRGR